MMASIANSMVRLLKLCLLILCFLLLLLLYFFTGTTNDHSLQATISTFDSLKDMKYELQDIDPNVSFPWIPSNYLQTSVSKDIREKSSSTFKVPNLVHYCWYTVYPIPLRFIDYLGFMSAYKFLHPDVVYFHLNIEPTGPYWQHIKDLPGVKINKTHWPTVVLGEKVNKSDFYTAGSNICRNVQIYHHGGIYLDLDVIAIRSFDQLRMNSCCLGLESPGRICGGIIICEKEAMFMKLWANSYLDDYRPNIWAYNTGIKPFQLSKRFPELVYVLPDKLNRPNWKLKEIDQLWGKNTWNWRSNFAVHTWFNKGVKYYREVYKDPTFTIASVQDIDSMHNCTFKTIAKYIIDA